MLGTTTNSKPEKQSGEVSSQRRNAHTTLVLFRNVHNSGRNRLGVRVARRSRIAHSGSGVPKYVGSPEKTELFRAINALARGREQRLQSLIHCYKEVYDLDGVEARLTGYCLQIDGSGRSTLSHLIDALVENLVLYSIPRNVIEKARQRDLAEDTTEHTIRLWREARELFSKLELSGEGGELLLWAISELVFRFPQVIAKMDLKTSSQMHFHGVDGVYLSADAADNTLSLYWGESKIYKNADSAIAECLESLASILKSQGALGDPSSRDFQLLRRHMDLVDKDLEEVLIKFFDPHEAESLSTVVKGIALVGAEEPGYPTSAGSTTTADVAKIFDARIKELESKFLTELKSKGIEAFEVILIFFPLESAQGFRDRIQHAIKG